MKIINTTSLEFTLDGGVGPLRASKRTISLKSGFDIVDEHVWGGSNAVRSAIEESLRKDQVFKDQKRNRSLLKNSPNFCCYRQSGNSELIHAAANATVRGDRMNRLISGLDDEIASSASVFRAGQALFHGCHEQSLSAQIETPLPSFLSTTLCAPVACPAPVI